MHGSKPLRFLDAAHNDLMTLPEEVRRELGYGLFLVQRGEVPNKEKP